MKYLWGAFDATTIVYVSYLISLKEQQKNINGMVLYGLHKKEMKKKKNFKF